MELSVRRRLGRFGGSLMAAAATHAVLAALGAVAYWGHHGGWTSPGTPAATAPAVGSAPIAVLSENDPAGNAGAFGGRRYRIVYPDAEAADRAGVDITLAWRAPLTEAVEAGGELGFDPGRVARVSSRAAGVAGHVAKAVGDPVAAGEFMALVDAAEVGKSKAEFQLALVEVGLRRKDAANVVAAGSALGAVSGRRRLEADAALREAEMRLLAAEQALANLGLPVRAADYEGADPQAVARRLRTAGLPAAAGGAGSDSANLLPVRAPLEGVVLSAEVVAGEVVAAGEPLFVVADARRLWLTLHVAAQDARMVSAGQRVAFRPDGSDADVSGVVSWVGSAADEKTRTVPVRAELDNAAGRLRASTLGRGRVVLREAARALLVPNDAVQRLRGTPVVFARDPDYLKPGAAKAFHARAVRVGVSDGRNTEILEGVAEGEVVVTAGGGALRDELLKAGVLAGQP